MNKQATLSLRAKRGNIILIFLLILPITVYAEENCKWKEVRGEALADTVTVEEAGRLALRRARLSATEHVAGVHVYGSDIVKNSALVGDFVMTLTEGYIVKEEILRWEAEFQQISNDKPPIPLYKVYARCCILISKEKRDPFFTVSSETNKPVFISGEEAMLKIRASRGAYISIFHLSSDEKLQMLLPNEFQRKQYIEEGKDLLFPPEGIGLEVKTAAGKKSELEYFIVVATKEWFDFEGQLKKDKDISLSLFYKALLLIPANMRAVVIGGYEVVSKE